MDKGLTTDVREVVLRGRLAAYYGAEAIEHALGVHADPIRAGVSARRAVQEAEKAEAALDRVRQFGPTHLYIALSAGLRG